jgi:hypothetical protein
MAEAWIPQERERALSAVGFEPIGWSGGRWRGSPVIGFPSQHQSMTHLRHVPVLFGPRGTRIDQHQHQQPGWVNVGECG